MLLRGGTRLNGSRYKLVTAPGFSISIKGRKKCNHAKYTRLCSVRSHVAGVRYNSIHSHPAECHSSRRVNKILRNASGIIIYLSSDTGLNEITVRLGFHAERSYERNC